MNKYILFLFILFNQSNCYCQETIKQDYDNYIISKNIGGFESIKKLAEISNSKYNIIISYFINANNIMFSKTNEMKYLNWNQEIVEILISQKKRLAFFYPHEGNNELNNNESILFEGYLNRYIAQYAYLLSKQSNMKLRTEEILMYLEGRFLFWWEYSLAATKDLSILYGIRLHMGVQWATLVLYLEQLSNKDKLLTMYHSFLEEFNYQLNNNFVYYNDNVVWNSTYNSKFTNTLKERVEEDVIQDTSHGNHIVEYILVQKELGVKRNNDLISKFSKTFLTKIVSENDMISCNIDGTDVVRSLAYLMLLSDGWMKLSNYDTNIYQYWKKIVTGNNLNQYNTYNQILAILYKDEN